MLNLGRDLGFNNLFIMFKGRIVSFVFEVRGIF